VSIEGIRKVEQGHDGNDHAFPKVLKDHNHQLPFSQAATTARSLTLKGFSRFHIHLKVLASKFVYDKISDDEEMFDAGPTGECITIGG